MSERLISAARDDSGSGTDTERWHIPREFEPNRPLCGANLAGRFKKSKGRANCSSCRSLATLQSFDPWRHGPILRALYLKLEVPPYEDKWISNDSLLEADLVAEKGGKLILTKRGTIVARDIIEPVGWLDNKTRLFHKRRALALGTVCGLVCGDWTAVIQDLDTLHAQAKAHGRHVYTCVRCAVHVD